MRSIDANATFGSFCYDFQIACFEKDILACPKRPIFGQDVTHDVKATGHFIAEAYRTEMCPVKKAYFYCDRADH